MAKHDDFHVKNTGKNDILHDDGNGHKNRSILVSLIKMKSFNSLIPYDSDSKSQTCNEINENFDFHQ